jgi:acetoin utilization deacetylase AcuC-like enzyme
MEMTRTGIVKDERYKMHHMGAQHPESPQRLEVVYSMLEESDMKGNFREIPVRRAERDELLLVHSPEYVDMVASTEAKDYTYLDPDTQTSEGSYEAALLAAGGLCEAISMVNSGELDNAFALVRPPGHHAERSRAMGFCLFLTFIVSSWWIGIYITVMAPNTPLRMMPPFSFSLPTSTPSIREAGRSVKPE